MRVWEVRALFVQLCEQLRVFDKLYWAGSRAAREAQKAFFSRLDYAPPGTVVAYKDYLSLIHI